MLEVYLATEMRDGQHKFPNVQLHSASWAMPNGDTVDGLVWQFGTWVECPEKAGTLSNGKRFVAVVASTCIFTNREDALGNAYESLKMLKQVEEEGLMGSTMLDLLTEIKEPG